MRRVWLLAALVVSACAGPMGPEGDEGPPGPQGPAGSSTSGPARVVYKDATGAVVAWDQLNYQDSAGRTWWLDGETLQIQRALHENVVLAYSGPGCSGTAYLLNPLAPRVPFKVVGETVFRVRPDAAQSAIVALQSIRTVNSCGSYAGTQRVFEIGLAPQDALLQEPTFGWTGPAHQERQ